MKTSCHRPIARVALTLTFAFSATLWFQFAPTGLAADAPASTSASAQTQPTKIPSGFMRVVDEDANTMRLDMAFRSFKSADGNGPTIILASAIHVGDKSFYQQAQKYLDAQDLVLYEGVGAHDRVGKNATHKQRIEQTEDDMRDVAIMIERYRLLTKEYPASLDALITKVGQYTKIKQARLKRSAVDAWDNRLQYSRTEKSFTLISTGADGKPGGKRNGADLSLADQRKLSKAEISNRGGIQNSLAEALGLTFQLNEFDTGKNNYRNSDLSFKEINKRMAGSGSNFRVMMKAMDGTSALSQLLNVVVGIVRSSPKMQATVKIVMMEALREMGDDITKMRGIPKSMQGLLKVILLDRNQKVIDDLKAEINRDPSSRTIAVWYGAAHMADLEKRMAKQLNYKPTANFWLPAITMKLDESGVSKQELKSMRSMIKQMMKMR